MIDVRSIVCNFARIVDGFVDVLGHPFWTDVCECFFFSLQINYPASKSPNLVRYLSWDDRDNRERSIQINGTARGRGQYGDNRERKRRGYTSKRGSRRGQYGDNGERKEG